MSVCRADVAEAAQVNPQRVWMRPVGSSEYWAGWRAGATPRKGGNARSGWPQARLRRDVRETYLRHTYGGAKSCRQDDEKGW